MVPRNEKEGRCDSDYDVSRQRQCDAPKKTFSDRLQRVALFYYDCNKPFKWGEERSLVVGVSCLFYLLPCLTLRSWNYWESNMWLVVSSTSFFSDFVFWGQRRTPGIRLVHLTDRWTASLALGYIAFVNVPFWFAAGLGIGLAGFMLLLSAVLCKVFGARAGCCSEFIFWHSMWHVVGGLGRSVQGYLEV